jgi:ribosomal protein S18 acetylase RimI-like enzyme
MIFKAESIKIFRATLDQIDAAYEIVSEYCQVENVVLRDTKEYFHKYFSENSGVFLAIEDDRAIGCVVLRPLGDSKVDAEMKRLYVKPEQRAKGIADRLVTTMHDYAKEKGYKWCYLDTADYCHAAIRLYDRHGYKMCERYNENPDANVFMRKKLDDID